MFFHSLSILPAAQLRGTLVAPLARLAVLPRVALQWQRVPVSGLVQTSEEAEESGGVRLVTVKLQCRLRCPWARPAEPAALLLTTTGGRRLLLGLDRPPHPLLSLQLTAPATPGGESALTLTAEYKGPYPLLPVYDL